MAFSPHTRMKEKILPHASVSKLLWVIPLAALVMLYLVFAATKSNQVILLHTDPEHITKIAAYLNTNKIEHRIVDTTKIYVDESIRFQTLLNLAKENLMDGDVGNGYELFDQFIVGMDEDLFRLNQKRAMEHKLARMIMDGNANIQNALVSIHYSKSSDRDASETPISASVKIVTTENVSRDVLINIQNLVVRAVGNKIKAEHVILLNQNNEQLLAHSNPKAQEKG